MHVELLVPCSLSLPLSLYLCPLPPFASPPRFPPLGAALRFFLTVFEAIVLTLDPNRISCEMLRKIEAQEEAERCRSVLLRLGTLLRKEETRDSTLGCFLATYQTAGG